MLQFALRLFHASIGALASSPEMVLCRLGILPEKRLRLRVVILRDENGVPLCDPTAITCQLTNAIQLFRRCANVRILPVPPPKFRSGFERLRGADQDFICVDRSRSSRCLLDSIFGRLRPRGRARMSFNAKVSRYCFSCNWRRVIGYGPALCVFVVRRISGGRVGWWPGPIADHTVIAVGDGTALTRYGSALAHELGHACGLPHVEDQGNLMHPMLPTDGSAKGRLTAAQIIQLRMSPHVTYW